MDVALENSRRFHCPVFGYIEFSPLLCSVIDTPQFQRLRYVKQMGLGYFVWPGACHNRFEHCLGTAHLAGLVLESLRRRQPDLGITDRDMDCVKIAGLCHDLGHGPFSHAWDNHYMRVVHPESKWTHEEQSEIMFDALVAENNVRLGEKEIAFVKDLIAGKVRHTKGHSPPEKSFLFQVIANKLNSLDVDKWDYLARDSLAVGDKGDWTALRLVDSGRVIDGEICYNIRDCNTILNLYQTRFKAHTIYNHKTEKAVQFMVIDALRAAEPVLEISRRLRDPRKFVHLTDHILLEIEQSEDPRLAEAQSFIHRIRVRDLYTYLATFHVPWSALPAIETNLSPTKIVQAARSLFPKDHPAAILAADLKEEHIRLDVVPLHYGMKEKNPLEFVHFYDPKGEVNKAFRASMTDVTLVLPRVFAELLVRPYSTNKRFSPIILTATQALLPTVLKGE